MNDRPNHQHGGAPDCPAYANGKAVEGVMAHMQMGKESMAQCLMMEMKGMDNKSGNAHKEHQNKKY